MLMAGNPQSDNQLAVKRTVIPLGQACSSTNHPRSFRSRVFPTRSWLFLAERAATILEG